MASLEKELNIIFISNNENVFFSWDANRPILFLLPKEYSASPVRDKAEEAWGETWTSYRTKLIIRRMLFELVTTSLF